MTINPNNTTAACSGDAELAVATAIAHIRALFEVAPWLASGNYVPDCGLVTFADLKAIQEYADAQFEAADLQASAPRSASVGDGVREPKDRGDGYYGCSAPPGACDCPQIDRHKCHRAHWVSASNPLEGKGIQSITEQASSGLRSPTSGDAGA